MRAAAFFDRVAAAVLHSQQFVLALVELVVADGSQRQSHHRQRLDRRLVVEHRRQKGAGADQVAGRDEDRVAVPVAKLPDQRRHVFGAARGNGDLLGFVFGVANDDSAGKGAQVAVKIVDRENAQIHWRCSLGTGWRAERDHDRQGKNGTKENFHGSIS